jgi:hypothetical protein
MACGPTQPATLRPRLVPPFASDLWAQPVGLIPSQVRSSTKLRTAAGDRGIPIGPGLNLLVVALVYKCGGRDAFTAHRARASDREGRRRCELRGLPWLWKIVKPPPP